MDTAVNPSQSYIALKTFKKNSDGVSTPVWVSHLHNNYLYVTTDSNSWKVKRIRNNEQVELVPCDARGNVEGDWYPAKVTLVTDKTEIASFEKLILNKYGLQARILLIVRSLFRRKQEDIILQLSDR